MDHHGTAFFFRLVMAEIGIDLLAIFINLLIKLSLYESILFDLQSFNLILLYSLLKR